MRRTVSLRILLLLAILMVILSLGFAACKGRGGGATAPVATSTSEAKAEVTRITDVTPPARYVWEQPTTMIQTKATSAAATSTPASADAKMIERGKRLYEKKGCGGCHGASGEGISDKGAKLAGTSLTAAEFEDILRTGGKVGNEHIFGISAISPSGIEAVYTFLQSLGR